MRTRRRKSQRQRRWQVPVLTLGGEWIGRRTNPGALPRSSDRAHASAPSGAAPTARSRNKPSPGRTTCRRGSSAKLPIGKELQVLVKTHARCMLVRKCLRISTIRRTQAGRPLMPVFIRPCLGDRLKYREPA